MDVTKAKAHILSLLAQEYCDRLCEEDLITFFGCTYLVWFNHFPKQHTPDLDAHKIEWQHNICKKVSYLRIVPLLK